MTTDTTTGNTTSTVTGETGTGEAAKTLLDTTGAAGDQGDNAGKTADTAAAGDAGKTADDADSGKTADKDGEGAAKSDESGKPKADDDKPAGPPEKYEFTMPDGVELDAALAEKADPVFRELGLSNEQANKLAAIIAEHRVSEGQALQDAYAKQMEDWANDTRADKEIGGDQLDANVKHAHRFIGEYGSPELKKLLADTGIGNHPEIVRLCVRAGKAMAEDDGVLSGAKSTPKSAADVLYDHPTSQSKR